MYAPNYKHKLVPPMDHSSKKSKKVKVIDVYEVLGGFLILDDEGKLWLGTQVDMPDAKWTLVNVPDKES